MGLSLAVRALRTWTLSATRAWVLDPRWGGWISGRHGLRSCRWGRRSLGGVFFVADLARHAAEHVVFEQHVEHGVGHDVVNAAGGVQGGDRLAIGNRLVMSQAEVLGQVRQGRKHGIRLIIVDYLHFVVAEDTRAPRHEQVAVITRRLKDLARELNVPVMVLAQLNRDADRDEVPRLSHLRESGSIEQDADTVLLLYRPESVQAPKNCLSVVVAKQRNGAVGQIDVYFDKTTGKISDLTLL